MDVALRKESVEAGIKGDPLLNNYLKESSGSFVLDSLYSGDSFTFDAPPEQVPSSATLIENSTVANSNTRTRMAYNGLSTWMMTFLQNSPERPAVFKSTDNGTSWSTLVIGTSGDMYAYDITYGAGRWVAVGNTSTPNPYVWTSTDGTTWSEIALTANHYLYGVRYSSYHTKWFAVGAQGGSGYPVIFTSTDGVSWSGPVTIGSYTQRAASAIACRADGMLVLVVSRNGSGTVSSYTSTDGTTWNGPYLMIPSGLESFFNIVWHPGTAKWYAVGGTWTPSGKAVSSSDGVNWFDVGALYRGDVWPYQSIIVGPGGNLVVATFASSAPKYPRAYSSTDGTTWSTFTMPTSITVLQWCAASDGVGQSVFGGVRESNGRLEAYVVKDGTCHLGVLPGDKLSLLGPPGAANTGKTFTIAGASSTALTVFESVIADPTTSYEYQIVRRKT